MKRRLCFMLCICMVLSCFAVGNVEANTGANAGAAKKDTTYYQDYERAFWKGYLASSYKKKSKTKQVTSEEYRTMLRTVIKSQGGSLKSFDKKVKKVNRKLTRGEAIIMSYYAAVAMKTKMVYFESKVCDREDFWEQVPDDVLKKQFPDVLKKKKIKDSYVDFGENEFMAAYSWNAMNASVYSNIPVVEFKDSKGMQTKKAFKMQDAICAVTRLCDGVHADKKKYVSLSDKKTTTPTLPLKKKAKIKDINKLPRLTGFVLSANESESVICQKAEDIANIANWGFSSARLMLHYRMLFNEKTDKVDLYQLERLDELVAAAEHYNIHLNLTMYNLPGRERWMDKDFNSGGDFDLFINPSKQKKVMAIWQLLAKRYKDVPGDNLSYTPFWEATNKNLSTGAAYKDYTPEDVYGMLEKLTDMMRKADKDCFIIYELTPGGDMDSIQRESVDGHKKMQSKYKNTMVSYNYCEGPFIYHNMTWDEGEDIDNHNHSMFLPDYPNIIYAASGDVPDDKPMTIEGPIPAGTTITVYLEHAAGGPLFTFKLASEKGVLYEESHTSEFDEAYKISYRLSGYYPYATSDKKIEVTLQEDVSKLTLATTDGYVLWSGIDVTLPKEYVQKKWYAISTYDQFLAGEKDCSFTKYELRSTSNIMLCPNSYDDGRTVVLDTKNLTYTSDVVFAEASPSFAPDWSRQIRALSPKCVVRFENATFSNGATRDALLKYYDATLSAFDQNKIGWYSNDYEMILTDSTWKIPDAKLVKYGKYEHFNMELLKLLQKHR